jgi:hypothetical protein
MNTNCEQVLNYCCSGSRGKNTIRNSTLNTISSVLPYIGGLNIKTYINNLGQKVIVLLVSFGMANGHEVGIFVIIYTTY